MDLLFASNSDTLPVKFIASQFKIAFSSQNIDIVNYWKKEEKRKKNNRETTIEKVIERKGVSFHSSMHPRGGEHFCPFYRKKKKKRKKHTHKSPCGQPTFLLKFKHLIKKNKN